MSIRRMEDSLCACVEECEGTRMLWSHSILRGLGDSRSNKVNPAVNPREPSTR